MRHETQPTRAIGMEDVPHGTVSVWRHGANGTPEMIEGDLPEEIARQMVADYAAEGETVWMEQTPAE